MPRFFGFGSHRGKKGEGGVDKKDAVDELLKASQRIEETRLLQRQILDEAIRLLQAIIQSESPAAAERLLQAEYGTFNSHSLRILDVTDELASEQATRAAVQGETAQTGRCKAVSAAIADALEHYCRCTAFEREQRLRLIGLPNATLRDFLENDEVAGILGEHFDAAGIINHIGVRHARLNEYQLALQFFKAAHDICPVHPEPPCNQGKAYTLIGEQEKALRAYEKAYLVNPGDPEIEVILRKHQRGPWQKSGAEKPASSEASEARSILLRAGEELRQLDQEARHLHQQGRYEQAIGVVTRALDLARQHFGETHPDFATFLNNLAELHRAMGNYAAAEPLCRRALEIRRTALGENHPHFAESLNNLAGFYLTNGNYTAAEPLFRQALEAYRTTVGENHPSFAESLNNLAELYQEMGRYAEAEPLFCQAREIMRTALGEAHPQFAGSLNNLAMLYRLMGNYAAAEPLFRQALEVWRTALGEAHPDFATGLHNLAGLYETMGNHSAAEPLYRQALEVWRMALGESHPNFAATLDKLAGLYESMGNYTAAEPLYRHALEIRRTALGESHPSIATTLDQLAALHRSTGDYAAAEPLFRQALEMRHTVLGESHPDFAASLNNLATLYRATGDYAAAEPLYRQALELWRTTVGENHPDFALCLNNLADLYYSMGDYPAAELYYRQALEIRRSALGESHPGFAHSLSNLAVLYRALGNYLAAEPLYRQALGVIRAALGENHPDFATGLNNLAELYRAMGKYAAAEPLCRRAVEIRRSALGESHPDFAQALLNLAAVYTSIGNYAAAEPLLRQALEITRTVLGDNHPLLTVILNNLAVHYHEMGDYVAAEPFFLQALEVTRTALGENHPQLIGALNNLAGLYAATAREADALVLKKQAAAIEDRLIGQVFSIGSESQRAAYLQTVRANNDAFLSLIFQHLPHARSAVQAGLELVLRRKGVGAEALAIQRETVLGGRYPALQPKLRELDTLRMQIARKTLNGPGPDGLAAHQRLLAEWNRRRERLEADLARQVPEMNLKQRLRAADGRRVVLALPEGAVLVEFIRCRVRDFHAVPSRNEPRWKPAHYLAFVVFAGEAERVEMIDLGAAEPIDRLIGTFRASITGEPEPRGSRDLLPLAGELARSDRRTAGAALREALFDPLSVFLGSRNRLLLAPDGDLTRLPFEVLPTSDDRRLIDDYCISYLATGRDALRLGVISARSPAPAVVIADPDFDLEGGTTTLDSVGAQLRGPLGIPGRLSRDLDRSSLHFDRLPGTLVEGERIASMLGVQPWLQGAAVEARLKACRSPRLLHIATHGFFLEDRVQDPSSQPFQDLWAAAWQASDGVDWLPGPGPENPLLRSGLALAGVNTWLRKGNPPAEAEDGLLTAEDVSGLDLLDTDLVVLSACETGLGRVQVGEGVFGLRRAFMLTGASTLVMSLWKVPDRQTQELMVDFYRRILNGQRRADALRAVQLAIRTKYPDPIYWGAFICQGDAGPLPS